MFTLLVKDWSRWVTNYICRGNDQRNKENEICSQVYFDSNMSITEPSFATLYQLFYLCDPQTFLLEKKGNNIYLLKLLGGLNELMHAEHDYNSYNKDKVL